MKAESGQASLELVAAIPALVIAALVAFQLLVTAYSVHVADGAAEAGALAVAGGAPAGPAVRAALPGWARERVQVQRSGGRVQVSVEPPAPLTKLSQALEVTSSAATRPSGG